MKFITHTLALLLSTTITNCVAAEFDYQQYMDQYINNAPEPTEEGSILLLGDSWAAIAGDYAANICGLSNSRMVTNDADNGSTASDWAEKGTAAESVANGGDGDGGFDYVWLSLGG